MLLSRWLQTTRARVEVDHVEGVFNDLADQLSRPALRTAALARLDASKRVSLDMAFLLNPAAGVTLHPADAPWPRSFRTLAAS